MSIDQLSPFQAHHLRSASQAPHILLAVGENPENHFGAKFLANFFSGNKQVKVSLLHILPPTDIEHTGPYGIPIKGGRMDEMIYAKRSTAANTALETVHKMLLSAGLDEKNVSLEARALKKTTALDIFNASLAGEYSSLILGKRGRTWLEDVFAGIPNITQEIITASCGMPIWTASGTPRTEKKVLLCVDGSPSSNNIVRHVGRSLACAEGFSITLLRVLRKNAATQKTADMIFHECNEILYNNGIHADSINFKVVNNDNIPETILAEAEAGQYGVVAAGRSGAGNSFLRNLLIGSVSLQLWKKLNNTCFWMTC